MTDEQYEGLINTAHWWQARALKAEAECTEQRHRAQDAESALLKAEAEATQFAEEVASLARIAQAYAESFNKAEAALRAVEPYLDAIICYASTISEHDGNRVAALVRAALPQDKGE